MVETMQIVTRLSPSGATCMGLQERVDASLVYPSSEEPLNSTPNKLSPMHIVEGKHDPSWRHGDAIVSRVPVVARDGAPLMPCKPSKARKLLHGGKAIRRWTRIGVFYLQLEFNPRKPSIQPIALGVDAGSKFEGFSVVGTQDTVLNAMSEAVDWVGNAVRQRRQMRRARRYRKTRRRKARVNRLAGKRWIPPSTKARWDAKLRIIRQLVEILPIQTVVVEDIKAATWKGKRKWNSSFSPLEVGKQYFHNQLGNNLIVKSGVETCMLREKFNLKKLRDKSKSVFETHCVDAWVLAASETGAKQPTTRSLYYLVPLRFHRRQLHRLQPEKGGKRKTYGGTNSHGLKRGTLVTCRKYGLCYVGGCLKDRLSLHSLADGKRLTQQATKQELHILTRLGFRFQFLPRMNAGVSLEDFR